MPARGVKSPVAAAKKEALVREILERVADKWTLLVIDALEGKTEVRFSRLRERIGGVSQKMLTKTLRQLERDGLLTRRVHAEVPPRVEGCCSFPSILPSPHTGPWQVAGQPSPSS